MVVRSQSFDPDVLIAVNQGGLVVTAAMNQSFQKPVGCLNTTIDSNSNTRVVGSLSLPHEVEHREGRYRTQRMAPRRVLVVDAKLKSGASLKAVQHILHMEYGNGVAIRYAIVLSYGGWADEKWEVLDPAFPWLARWRDRDLECYVAFYTDVDAPNEPDSHAELVRPGWTHD